MTEKLKVSEEVGLALHDLFNRNREHYPFEYILMTHSQIKDGRKTGWSGEYWDSLNKLSLSEMAQCIYVGYEVEKSMEEKLALLLKKTENQHQWSEFDVRLLIIEALEVVGIKVPIDYWKDNL